MVWLKEEIEFADGGPVMPVGCRVELYSTLDERFDKAEVEDVTGAINRKEKAGGGEHIRIVINGRLAGIPRRNTTTIKPEHETEAFMRREHGSTTEG